MRAQVTVDIVITRDDDGAVSAAIKRADGTKRELMNLRPDDIGTTDESFPLFRCPGCKQVGDIDDDEFHGRVSIDCTNCEYHETKDWSESE